VSDTIFWGNKTAFIWFSTLGEVFGSKLDLVGALGNRKIFLYSFYVFHEFIDIDFWQFDIDSKVNNSNII